MEMVKFWLTNTCKKLPVLFTHGQLLLIQQNMIAYCNIMICFALVCSAFFRIGFFCRTFF